MSPKEPRELYDVVIVGGGPAGLAAAVYSARQGMVTAIVMADIGGQAAWAGTIENYLGWQLITGAELVERFKEHLNAFEVDCFEGRLVSAVVAGEDAFEVFTRENDTLRTRALIIATGRAPNRLAVPGETELIGKGVSYCTTCDAPFFKGKTVVVTGPGAAAAEAALQLAGLGSFVMLVSEQPLRGVTPAAMERIAAYENVKVRSGVKVEAIEGDGHVERVKLMDLADRSETTIDAAGVFIELGAIPVAEFTGGLVETNDSGEVIVDNRGETSRPGIYAAGDVTDGLGKQVIIAAGEGARAAIAAYRDLQSRPIQPVTSA
jgi:NADH-dependent peroxiredoxin subunit F